MALTDKLTAIANAIRSKNGSSAKMNMAQMATAIANISTPPEGFTAIKTGTHTLSSAVAGGSTFTLTHSLGQTPDLLIFYAPANIATTYSMLLVMRGPELGWRSTSYLNKCFYHGNSTTTVTGADVTTSYGIKTMDATSATITTYSNSGSYYWRAGTYKWIAIKF